MSRLPGKPASREQYVTLVVKDDERRNLTRTMRKADELKVIMDFYYDMVPTVKSGDGFFLHRRKRMPIMYWMPPEFYGKKDGDVIQFVPHIIKPDMLVTPVLQDFRGLSFTRTMRKTVRMQVLMDFYHGVVPGDGDPSGVFLYRGERVPGEQTPAGLGMADWDRIYFVPRRRGEVVEDKSDDYITVKVRDDKERTVYSTMRRSDKLKSLMDLYYATVLGAESNGAFIFDARELRRSDTLSELEMEDGDEMDYLPSVPSHCG